MSISVELKMTGNITTPEHQAAIKKIMDAVEQAASGLPGVGYPIRGSRYETKSYSGSRMLMPDGTIDPTPFPLPAPSGYGYMHEARLQFGFHLNPVKPDIVPDGAGG